MSEVMDISDLIYPFSCTRHQKPTLELLHNDNKVKIDSNIYIIYSFQMDPRMLGITNN